MKREDAPPGGQRPADGVGEDTRAPGGECGLGWAVFRWPWSDRGRHASVPGRVRAGVVRRWGSDRGSATVWSLGAMALLCAVFGAVLCYGQAVAVRHRAAGGADLAALAAADHWAEGATAACARAERLAAAQGVRLVRCAIVGDTSDVTAAVGKGPFAAEVRARAGPPGPVPPAGLGLPGVVPPDVPDGFRAVPPAGPVLPGPEPPGHPDGFQAVRPAGPGPPVPMPSRAPDGLRAIPPAEPGAPPAPPSP
ncbi:hypothetical protein SUDANB180_04245 [Streptomyces sp. enrichment culture]